MDKEVKKLLEMSAEEIIEKYKNYEPSVPFPATYEELQTNVLARKLYKEFFKEKKQV